MGKKLVDLKSIYERETTDLVAESLRLMETGHGNIVRENEPWSEAYEAVYIGTCFAILPSGMYYVVGLTSNQSCRDVIMDNYFMELLERKLNEVHLWQMRGEGSPSDIFVCRSVNDGAPKRETA
jgi:hypothetical protein|tara:strand:+ start:287 stop:658 length:372 start_codon:yes stop_codon:yes gene_type:complete